MALSITLIFDVRAVLNGANIRHDASLFFDGVDDYVRVRSGIDLKGSSTVEMWVKRDQSGGAETFFSQGINTTQSYSLGFNASDNLIVTIAGQTFVSSTTITPTVPTVNGWNHIACSYDKDNDDITLMINGVASGVNNSFVTNLTEGGDIYVGKSTNSAETFEGNIHEVRIWNKI